MMIKVLGPSKSVSTEVQETKGTKKRCQESQMCLIFMVAKRTD